VSEALRRDERRTYLVVGGELDVVEDDERTCTRVASLVFRSLRAVEVDREATSAAEPKSTIAERLRRP